MKFVDEAEIEITAGHGGPRRAGGGLGGIGRRALGRRAPAAGGVVRLGRGGRDRRRTRPGSRGVRWTDATLPDEDADLGRRLDHGELDVGARLEPGMGGQRRSQAVEPFRVGQPGRREGTWQKKAPRIAPRRLGKDLVAYLR